MSIEISDTYIYIYIYMWPYVNLYAHAREIIAKKRPLQLTTDLLFLSSADQPRQPSRHSPEQINDGSWTLSTDYACSYDCIIKEGGASYRTLWIVHSHYRGTVKSKYVDIAISFA